MTETISTSRERVQIKTPRGIITFGPKGEIEGLWRVCSRELRTNEQVRKLCGGITRATLIRWRANGFPEPVMILPAHSQKLELWSRTAVEAWMRANRPD